MPGALVLPKIFLSSTSIDLKEARAELIHWLREIFGAQLIVMESFGSDTAPPDVASVRRVRECDIFVGMYAHRYGTIEPTTGKSITELELEEARSAHSAGVIRDILLYVLDPASKWLVEYRQSESWAQAGLQHLRRESTQHTYTPFTSSSDLLPKVIRDIYHRITERTPTEPTIRPAELPAATQLERPVGMLFLTSSQKEYLIGRDFEVRQLLELLQAEPIVLLLGDSGVGKTSLIHAGVAPAAVEAGWRIVHTRPLGFPQTEVVRRLQASIFLRPYPYHVALYPALAQIAQATSQTILLVIDQFEDILAARDESQVEGLISDLRQVRDTGHASVRILVSYRADVEGRLGKYWQAITGSPTGLPRIYLDGIRAEAVWDGVVKAVGDLQISLALTSSTIDSIKGDMVASSNATGCHGIYPPYVQMLLQHFWDASRQSGGEYRDDFYSQQCGLDGIIGQFLSGQLKYAVDATGHVRSVLVALVKSRGTKVQLPIDDISAEAHISPSDCESALERLIGARLVRHVGGYYEITHDLIAQRILAEMVDPEEREYKESRELLAAKAASYAATGNVLAAKEMLKLYRHRARVDPNPTELRLMLASWVRARVPGLYWLMRHPSDEIDNWLDAEEERDGDIRAPIVVLRALLGRRILTSADYLELRDYQLAIEMATLISERRALVPKDVVRRGLQHRREEVREACLLAIQEQVRLGDLSWLDVLWKSHSMDCRLAYAELVLRPEPHNVQADGGGSLRLVRVFGLLRELTTSSSRSQITNSYRTLARMRPPGWVILFARGLVYVASGRIITLLRQAERSTSKGAEVLLGAIGANVGLKEFGQMLSAYHQWNMQEGGWNRKTMALGLAIRRATTTRHLRLLRRSFRRIRLTPSAREIVMALLQHGEIEDIEHILRRIADSTEVIDFQNHAGLSYAVMKRMQAIEATGIPSFLQTLLRREEFAGGYIGEKERRVMREEDRLPVRLLPNRPLYIRIAAFAAIGMARSPDVDMLLDLVGHHYGLIVQTATTRLVDLLGINALERLSHEIDKRIDDNAEDFAESLRWAEIELHRQQEGLA